MNVADDLDPVGRLAVEEKIVPDGKISKPDARDLRMGAAYPGMLGQQLPLGVQVGGELQRSGGLSLAM